MEAFHFFKREHPAGVVMREKIKFIGLSILVIILISCEEPASETPTGKSEIARIEPLRDIKQSGPLKESVQNPTQNRPWRLSSLEQIKLRPGIEGPKLGETIYQIENLPKAQCGTFWVQSSDGFVEQLAICTGDHPEGEGH